MAFGIVSSLILCPIDKVEHVVGKLNRIIKLIEDEIGVNVEVTDPIAGSNEQTIVISSSEGADNKLFPAQEALLRIQTRIVNLVLDTDNFITIRLLVQSSKIGCLEGALVEMRTKTGAHILILHGEQLPIFRSGTDEPVQGREAVRDALFKVMSRQWRYFYGEFFSKDMPPPPISAVNLVGSALRLKAPSPNNITPPHEGQTGSDQPTSSYQNVAAVAIAQPLIVPKDVVNASATLPNTGVHSISVSHVNTSNGVVSLVESWISRALPELVFRILCLIDKVEHVVGKSNRIIKLIEDEIDVNVEVTDPIVGSNEQTIVISSFEHMLNH
ncbi:hypothetical protein L1049_026750 [Liquidambar formosana]|uniref:K Homology domain-containing protein n=1 Tax=Liquidambar formosana TaxID=63359 RepID=A0AAP0NFI4_LIQFO